MRPSEGRRARGALPRRGLALAGRVEDDPGLAHVPISFVTGALPVGPAGPAPDDGREQARATTGVDDEQPAVPELGEGRALDGRGEPLGDAAGAPDQLVAGDLEATP